MFCTNCGSNAINESGVCLSCGHRMGGAPAAGIPTGRLDIAGGVKKMFRHPVFITATILMLATWVISIFSAFSAMDTASSYGVKIDLDGFFSSLEYLPDEMRFFIILVMVGIVAILVSGIMCVIGLVKSLCYSFGACRTPGLGALKGYCAFTIIGLSAIVAGYVMYIVQMLGQIPSYAREYAMDAFWEQSGPALLILLVVIVLMYIYYALMISMLGSVSNTLKYNTPMKKPSMFVAVFNFILAVCGICAIFGSEVPLEGMNLISSIAQLVALVLYGVLIIMARNITFEEIYAPDTSSPSAPEMTAPVPEIQPSGVVEGTSTYCTYCGKPLAAGEECNCMERETYREETSAGVSMPGIPSVSMGGGIPVGTAPIPHVDITPPVVPVGVPESAPSRFCSYCGKALYDDEVCACERIAAEAPPVTDATYSATSEPTMSGTLKSTMRKPGSAPASYHGETGPNKFMSRPDDLD